jgi:hypothetical protein
MRQLFISVLIALLGACVSAQGLLRVNEVMALNRTGLLNPLSRSPGDWIEIYNGTSASVDLGYYSLSDNPEVPHKWKFPPNSILPSGSYLVVWADGTGATTGGPHTNFKLDVAGETLWMHAVSGQLIDSLTFPRMYEDISYGLTSEGERMFFSSPSPGSENRSSSGYRIAGKVGFNPPAGIFASPQQVELKPGISGGTIRYTLDGSLPGLSDPVYSKPIPIGGSTVIRARTWAEGYEPGEPSTSSYIFHDVFDMPVISLVSDPVNLWDDQMGIYVEGKNGITGYCSDVPLNWNQDWERPVSMEYFDPNGVMQLQIDGGIKIHGGCSRQAPMKSLGIFARSEYGSNSMNYPFFRDKDIESFKGLILRNAGNDYWYSWIRDASIQVAVTPYMDLDAQAYEPVQVFLNGVYWGIHNLREKVNEHWVTSNYGIPADHLDFIKNFYEVFEGSDDAFMELTRYLEQNSLVADARYQVVADQIDIGSYINYLITELFFANRDWPGNNQKYWRDRVNGSKWRWIMFDMEFSMGLYEFNPALDMFSFATADDVYQWPNPTYATLLIRRLMENEGFRKQFLQTYMMHLNTTLKSEKVIQVIDSLQNGLYDAFPAHISRWGQVGSMGDWNNKVEQLREFVRQRPDFVWNNMRNFFSLGERVSLRIEPPEGSGEIIANGVWVPGEGLEGYYAAGFDLDLEFIAAPGYRFNHWEVSSFLADDKLLVPRNSVWRYLDTGIYPGDGWQNESFNDAGWAQGAGELGYGDGGESTVIGFGGDDQNKHIAYYFRKKFQIADTAGFERITLRIMRDDGAVVYINGSEVLRDNLPEGEILPDTPAITFVGDADEYTYFLYTIDGRTLKPGTNTIAVEIHQNSPTSSDISFDLELAAAVFNAGDTMEYESTTLSLQLEGAASIRPITEETEMEMELYINEVMASNQGAFYDEFNNDVDWIEVYNAGPEDVDMAGLCFTDDLEQPEKWRIPRAEPGATIIRASDYLIFFADGSPLYGPLHLDFKLSAAGEEVGLCYRKGQEIIWLDTMSFGSQTANISLGRYPDGSSHWIRMGAYTPGNSNVQTSVSAFENRELEISLFPVPASEFLNIRLRTPIGVLPDEVTLHLVDLAGRRIMQVRKSVWGNEFNDRIDISSLPDGIYLVVFETPASRYSRKFVKSSR